MYAQYFQSVLCSIPQGWCTAKSWIAILNATTSLLCCGACQFSSPAHCGVACKLELAVWHSLSVCCFSFKRTRVLYKEQIKCKWQNTFAHLVPVHICCLTLVKSSGREGEGFLRTVCPGMTVFERAGERIGRSTTQLLHPALPTLHVLIDVLE